MAALDKHLQTQYQTASAVAGKTISSIEVFNMGSKHIAEIICTDGTKAWITALQGVLSVTSVQPY